MLKPHYFLSVGDPLGIGPEITLKLLEQQRHQDFVPYQLTVVSSKQAMEKASASLATVPSFDSVESLLITPPCWLRWHWIDALCEQQRSQPVAYAGSVAYHSIAAAVSLLAQAQREKKATGLLTGPISKQHLWEAGFTYSGHTELLQELANQYWQQEHRQGWHSDMLFLYKRFRLILLTRHIPLAKVSHHLSLQGVRSTTQQLLTFLKQHEHINAPKLAFLGVNPHAGEIGGDEEALFLKPLVAELTLSRSIERGEILPADAAFRDFDSNNPPYDAYIAAYHDQGLIPMKLVAGLKAVNVTIGLPFTRTSVSHGTGFDIAGSNVAKADSLQAALDTLHRLVKAAE